MPVPEVSSLEGSQLQKSTEQGLAFNFCKTTRL